MAVFWLENHRDDLFPTGWVAGNRCTDQGVRIVKEVSCSHRQNHPELTGYQVLGTGVTGFKFQVTGF